MLLPKKITPELLKETIVQIFFVTELPFEAMVGYLYKPMLELGLNYTNKSLRGSNTLYDRAAIHPEDGVTNVPQHYFFDDTYIIQLNPNKSIIFNCLGEYVGWDKYIQFIKMVMTKFIDVCEVSLLPRIGCRYITEFPSINLTNKVKFNYKMIGVDENTASSGFQISWEVDSHRIFANIGLNIIISPVQINNEEIGMVSVIDLDVINSVLQVNNVSDLIDAIDCAHTKQKSLFFELLEDDFLKTLNPVY